MVSVKTSRRNAKHRDLFLKEISLQEFLGDIGIEPDDYKELSDESCIILTSNLEEEQKESLKEIGLEDLGYNLFYSEHAKVNVDEKFQRIESSYIKEETARWEEIINKIVRIEKYSSKGKICPFEPSISQFQIAMKWKGTLVRDMSSFKDFVNDLYKFFIESLKNNIEDEYEEHHFWKTIIALRNVYFHDTTRWRDKAKTKIAQIEKDFFQDAIQRDYPKTPFGFALCQLKLFEICSDFLESILLNTSETK